MRSPFLGRSKQGMYRICLVESNKTQSSAWRCNGDCLSRHHTDMTTQQMKSVEQNTIDTVGGLFARYGLVIVIAWYGALKFTNYEAQGIAPLVSESPFMSWLYDIVSVYTFSVLLGVF